eukprot:15326029-Alexandrium_andersonii.AAC.1
MEAAPGPAVSRPGALESLWLNDLAARLPWRVLGAPAAGHLHINVLETRAALLGAVMATQQESARIPA